MHISRYAVAAAFHAGYDGFQRRQASVLLFSHLQRFVARLSLRSALDAEAIESILALPADVVEVERGRDVVRAGDHLDSATLVLEGLAARYERSEQGDRQITAFHVPGDMCNLETVPVPVAAWGIEALSTLRVARIPHTQLITLASSYPQIAFALWRDTTADTSILAEWMSNLGRRDARGRLAHLICEIGVRLEYAGLGNRSSFSFAATQSHLADALAMTSVHLNRVIQTLRRDGHVTWRGSAVTVPRWDALAALARFDEEYLQVARLHAGAPSPA